MGRILCGMTVALLLALGATPSFAARVALVIGNDAYRELPVLQKATADATSFAELLGEKGFDKVILRNNLDRSGMDVAVAEFLDAINPGDTAVFFYSGHGWSDGGQNYLVPVDAPIKGSEVLLSRMSIPLQNGATGILDEIASRGATLKVAIVDACRDNPFQPSVAGRSIGMGRGLVRVEPTRGTFVVFSAGTGQTALDRLSDNDSDRNSVFTRTFLPLLRADMPLQQAVKAAQQQVHDIALTVSHDQEPAYYDQVLGSACLSASCDNPQVAVNVTPPDPGPARQDAPPAGVSDERAYQAAAAINTCQAYQSFADSFPASFYATLARQQAETLCRADQPPPQEEAAAPPTRGMDDQAAYDAAVGVGTCDAMMAFVQAFPTSFYATLAKERAKAACAAAEPQVAAIPQQSEVDEGFIFPDSDVRRLTRADIAGLSKSELRFARNEIFARKGRYFNDAALTRRFQQYSWYQPYSWDVPLNAIETANVEFLKAAEDRR